MRQILIALMVVCASPAFAAECRYVSGSGDELKFLNDGENTVTIVRSDGVQDLCSWAATPDRPDPQDIACESGLRDGFWFAPAELGGSGQDLLIFANGVWYRQCQ